MTAPQIGMMVVYVADGDIATIVDIAPGGSWIEVETPDGERFSGSPGAFREADADDKEAAERAARIARREAAERDRGNPTPLLGALMGEVFG